MGRSAWTTGVVMCALIAILTSGCNSGSGHADQSAADAQQAEVGAIPSGSPTWDFSASSAQMITGGVNRFASIISTNSVNFGFPYAGTQYATLTIRKMADATWEPKGDPGYEVMISIDRGQLLSGDQGSIKAKIDDAAPVTFNADPPDDNDTTTLFFYDRADMHSEAKKGGNYTFTATFPLQQFIENLQQAKTLKVQVTAYQNGNPVFVFNVSGFSLAKLNATEPTSPVDASSVR